MRIRKMNYEFRFIPSGETGSFLVGMQHVHIRYALDNVVNHDSRKEDLG